VRGQYKHFVVDEYQDVSPLQQRLLDLWLGRRRQLCVVGDVSQTIMGEYFTMIMHCSFDEEQQNLIDLQEAMIGVEHEQKAQIRIQAESIFKAMHSI